MIHPNSKLFFQQWTRAHQRRYEPVDHAFPDEVAAELDRWSLDIRPAADRSFRILELGSGVQALLGRSPVGTPFNWLFYVGERPEIDRLVQGAYHDGTGLVVAAAGIDDDGGRVPIEIILLPSRPDQPPALAGCLSPLSGSGAGGKPIGLMRLVSMRVPLVPDAMAGQPSARMRAGMACAGADGE